MIKSSNPGQYCGMHTIELEHCTIHDSTDTQNFNVDVLTILLGRSMSISCSQKLRAAACRPRSKLSGE